LQEVFDLETVGDVRGIGLLWGVEFVADKQTKRPFPAKLNFAGRVGQMAARRGLLVYPVQGSVDGDSGDHVLIAPPAVITEQQVGWAVGELKNAIAEASQPSPAN
jgi:adenosylmethionine-8-amino-7-oxononanoate aminotransferase